MRNLQQSLRRSRRRATHQTRIERAMRKWREWGLTDADMLVWARKNADNMKACSCYLCCHNRRVNGLTLQEKRSNLALNEKF